MRWMVILKNVDYNKVDDRTKMEIIMQLFGGDFTVDEYLGDYYNDVNDMFGISSVPPQFGFPSNFEMYAEGPITTDSDSINFDVFLYIINPDNDAERYYLGGWFGDINVEDLQDFQPEYLEGRGMTVEEALNDWDFLEGSSMFPNFRQIGNPLQDLDSFTKGSMDYNKLVSYLKEAGKWNEDMEPQIKSSKVNHRKEVKDFLEDAHDYAAQRFEQSFSEDSDMAKEFYDLLEYLETTREDTWNRSQLSLKYPAAMLIVSETLGGFP